MAKRRKKIPVLRTRLFRLLLFYIFLISPVLNYAQDIIVTTSGEEMKVKVVKITEDEITYKKYGSIDGPDYVVKKIKVAAIKYQNGSSDMFGTNALQAGSSNFLSASPASSGNDSLLKILDAKIQRDSLELEKLKTISQNSNIQNKELLEHFNSLAENLNQNNNLLLEELKKQHSETLEQSEKELEQSKQISENVSKLDTTIKSQSSQQEDNWKPKVVGGGIDAVETMINSAVFFFALEYAKCCASILC